MGEASSRLLSGSHGEANAAAIAYKALLAVAQAQPGTKGLRVVALLRLLHDLVPTLRRA
jgi:hypothetical protein